LYGCSVNINVQIRVFFRPVTRTLSVALPKRFSASQVYSPTSLTSQRSTRKTMTSSPAVVFRLSAQRSNRLSGSARWTFVFTRPSYRPHYTSRPSVSFGLVTRKQKSTENLPFLFFFQNNCKKPKQLNNSKYPKLVLEIYFKNLPCTKQKWLFFLLAKKTFLITSNQ